MIIIKSFLVICLGEFGKSVGNYKYPKENILIG